MHPMYSIDLSDRDAHQPAAVPLEFEEPNPADLKDSCGSTIAVILALEMGKTPLKVMTDDPDAKPVVCDGRGKGSAGKHVTPPRPLQEYQGRPLVVHALRCALDSHVRRVFVLAADEHVLDAALKAAEEAFEQDDARIALGGAVLDPSEVEAVRRASGNYELVGVPAAALVCAAQLLKDDLDATSVAFLSCDQVRIRPRHLKALCDRLANPPGTDVVTSWILWLRRTPLLVARDFVETICPDSAGGCICGPELAALHVEEVVFGEERLAANPVIPPSRVSFEKELTLSALEAVRRARAMLDGEKSDSGGVQGEDAAKSAVAGESSAKAKDTPDAAGASPAAAAERDPLEGLGLADRKFVKLAQDVLARMDDALAGDTTLRTRLTEADELGRRTKLDFPLFSDRRHEDCLVYLDTAATAQRLGRALDAQEAFDKGENANVYRGCYALSAQATASLNTARKTLEDFIGAKRRETVFTQNATDSCNRVAQAWGDRNVNEGDLVVVSLAEHHSNLVPWMMLASRRKARLAYIPVDNDGRLDQDAYDELLEQHPKIVCIAQVGNVLGIENPVADMARKAHAVGARVMVDAAQSIAHLALDVGELGADFVAFSGHKLYGPLGIGGLWIAPEAFDEMDPSTCGGGAISHVSQDSYYLRAGAIQYEIGTPPISQAIGLAAAIEYLDCIGMDKVAAHDAALTDYLLAGLSGIDGVRVIGDHGQADGKSGLVSLCVANAESAQVGTVLGELGVAVRSGGHCALPLAAAMGVTGTTRISFGVHTTKEDIEAAVVALELCTKLYAADEVMGKGSFMGEEDALAKVERHYAEVAESVSRSGDEPASSSCCEASCCGAGPDSGEVALYATEIVASLPDKAKAASRGCGDPVSRANLQLGETVCDLGSGGGIDALIAARLVGAQGYVFGIDMTESMLELARNNAQDAGAANVEFIQGRIEDIPLPDASVDAVISNCAINFSENKRAVFAEALRILKPGGRFVVSDITGFGEIPDDAQEVLQRATGCLNGITGAREYEETLYEVGFERVSVEPKTIYTMDVFEERMLKKGRPEIIEELRGFPEVDGVTGSAIVTAFKGA